MEWKPNTGEGRDAARARAWSKNISVTETGSRKREETGVVASLERESVLSSARREESGIVAQVLVEVLVGPVQTGTNKFVLHGDASRAAASRERKKERKDVSRAPGGCRGAAFERGSVCRRSLSLAARVCGVVCGNDVGAPRGSGLEKRVAVPVSSFRRGDAARGAPCVGFDERAVKSQARRGVDSARGRPRRHRRAARVLVQISGAPAEIPEKRRLSAPNIQSGVAGPPRPLSARLVWVAHRDCFAERGVLLLILS